MTVRWLQLIIFVTIMLLGRTISQGQREIRYSSLSQIRTITKDWTALLVAISTAIGFTFPVLEYALREKTELNLYGILIGLALIITGYIIAFVANRAIQENWSPTIEKTQEQNLVTTGIYSTIRHPLYLSGLLILVGANIYFSNSWAWSGVALVLLAILIRLPIEEQRLVDRFGQDYIEYRKRTRALLPWIF
jgi:protein-S-isoprenylcysteine O-methyltransferase Ste14